MPSLKSLLALAAPFAAALATPITHERRASQSAPHFVAYWDNWVSGEVAPPTPATLSGFNTLILSFLLSTGAADQCIEWQSIDASARASTKSSYAAAGMVLMASAFGSTEQPTTSGLNPTNTANTMAAWIKTYTLDGIDVDYEDFSAINKADGSAESWLITFTTALRAALPAGQYIITHAPVAPWFSPIYTAGAYTKVHAQVGSLIDWYNIQFYNQGVTEYTTCAGLLTASSSTFPSTAVMQIHSVAGVSLDKIVIGKPGTTADANNGYIDPSTLAGCLLQGKNQGWTGGAMVWQYPNAASSWITTVRSQAWPVGSVITNPTTTAKATTSTTTTSKATTTTTTSKATTTAAATTTKTTSAAATTTTSSNSSCAGVAAWVSTVAYTGGQQVTYGGYLWQALYWSEADVPGGAAGDWTKVSAC